MRTALELNKQGWKWALSGKYSLSQRFTARGLQPCPHSLLMKATIKIFSISFHIKLALQIYNTTARHFISAAMVTDAESNHEAFQHPLPWQHIPLHYISEEPTWYGVMSHLFPVCSHFEDLLAKCNESQDQKHFSDSSWCAVWNSLTQTNRKAISLMLLLIHGVHYINFTCL